MKDNYALIMAGGVGSRFWPMSTSQRPKQFIDILGLGKSLLQMTVERISSLVPITNIYILTNSDYFELVKEQIEGIPSENIVCEPQRKNTAPCLAFASAKIHQKNPNARLVVLPSDHLILNKEAFLENIKTGLRIVEDREIVTIGIHPTRPETGYGYIEFDNKEIFEDDRAYRLKQFREKPSLELAKEFIDSGNFYWNAGIFMWSSKTIHDSFQHNSPALYELFMRDLNPYNTEKEEEFARYAFDQCEDISVDYAILEKAKNVVVIAAQFDWSDLGTWNSLSQHLEKDKHSNFLKSKNTHVFDTTGTIVFTDQNKQVIIDGLNDYLVVDEKDKLMILKLENDQKLKEYLKKSDF